MFFFRRSGCRNSSVFFFSSRRRHTTLQGDWSSDVCSSDLSTRPLLLLSKPEGASGSTEAKAKKEIASRDRPMRTFMRTSFGWNRKFTAIFSESQEGMHDYASNHALRSLRQQGLAVTPGEFPLGGERRLRWKPTNSCEVLPRGG